MSDPRSSRASDRPEPVQGRIRLVARADDAGSCHGANAAIGEVIEAGLARNVSVMVPGPAFAEAAEMLTGRNDICLGLHATITAEWDTLKWGPVLPAQRVGTLLDDHGHFPPDTKALHARGADPDQVLAEIEAQLARARAHGLAVAYLDEHMCFRWLPGVAERLDEFARREGLLRGSGTVPGLAAAPGHFDDLADRLIASLAAAGPGTHLWVAHPGRDDEETRRLVHAGLAPGQVARERQADTRMFTSPKVLDYCKLHGIEPVRYTDVLVK